MSDATPRFQPGHEAEGKVPAIAAWALYILSIPSANLLVLVGLIVAYAARSGATGVPRQHTEEQIRFFWSIVWWTIGCWIGIIISIPLMIVAVGFVTLPIFAIALLLIHVWFTIKSFLALLNLLGDKAP